MNIHRFNYTLIGNEQEQCEVPFSEENGFTEPTDVSRPNKRRIASYWPRLFTEESGFTESHGHGREQA